MARSVFFSFHYQRDIMRVQVVKQHYTTKGNYTAAGYFDGSLEEKAKKEGEGVVKRLIDQGLQGSSVLCVLIGRETYTRRWVDYEILKSVALGMGVFGIKIHQIADARRSKEPNGGLDDAGNNPFYYLGYKLESGNLEPMIRYKDGWKAAPNQQKISPTAAPYLRSSGDSLLSDVFKVYDWVDDNGFKNFGNWVEAAAKQAGR